MPFCGQLADEQQRAGQLACGPRLCELQVSLLAFWQLVPRALQPDEPLVQLGALPERRAFWRLVQQDGQQGQPVALQPDGQLVWLRELQDVLLAPPGEQLVLGVLRQALLQPVERLRALQLALRRLCGRRRGGLRGVLLRVRMTPGTQAWAWRRERQGASSALGAMATAAWAGLPCEAG